MSAEVGLARRQATWQSFRPGSTTPALARSYVRGCLARRGATRYCQEIAELIVSELVTNAVIHARSAARVSVTVAVGEAWIEVSDNGPGCPELRDPGHDSGFGLTLVDLLAQYWGVSASDNGQGKTVWARVSLSAEPPPGPPHPASGQTWPA